MNFLNFNEIKKLDKVELEIELQSAKKELFELRLKKATRQTFKPHIFKSLKKKIAHILTIQSEQLITIK